MPAFKGVEERDLWIAYSTYPSLAIRDELFSRHRGLIWWCVKRFHFPHKWHADLYQAGSVGMLKAISGFDHSRGTKFSGYAVKAIKSEMITWLRKAPFISWHYRRSGVTTKVILMYSGRFSHSLGIQDDLTTELQIPDPHAAKAEEAMLNRDELAAARRVLKRLKPHQQEILLSRSSMTLQALADRFGVTRERIRQIQVGAQRLLLQEMNTKQA